MVTCQKRMKVNENIDSEFPRKVKIGEKRVLEAVVSVGGVPGNVEAAAREKPR